MESNAIVSRPLLMITHQLSPHMTCTASKCLGNISDTCKALLYAMNERTDATYNGGTHRSHGNSTYTMPMQTEVRNLETIRWRAISYSQQQPPNAFPTLRHKPSMVPAMLVASVPNTGAFHSQYRGQNSQQSNTCEQFVSGEKSLGTQRKRYTIASRNQHE